MSSYTVSDYLLDRLAELGADTIFGVPGDYTLQLLDHIIDHEKVSWTGCANELNSGYAADGYARIRGIGALCTTFGVGELSAINAIAGSYAEYVPVIHIVGAPASGVQAAQRVVHHSLGDGIFSHFLDMHAPVTCAQAVLTPATAAAEIDRVLSAVRDQKLPGYLLLPADLAEAPCPPPAEPLPAPAPVTDPATLDAFTDAARRLLATARSPRDLGLLAGLLVHRLSATAQLDAVLAAGSVPHASTLWAKSVVDENTPGFAGMYAGAISDPPAKAAIEDARVLILAGVQITDLNSGFFTQRVDRPHTIELAAASASVGAPWPRWSPSCRRPTASWLRPGPRTRPSAAIRTPRCPRPAWVRSWRPTCSPATSSWPTRAPRSTGRRPTGCRPVSPSSASRCGPRSATPCRRCSAPAWPTGPAGACCWSATARRR
jgi:indolepyruvate decarboxylase